MATTFEELGLNKEILSAIKDADYKSPTPIQEKAIPEILNGYDIFGCAQTGTGKTAAFVLPILQKFSEHLKYVEECEFRALILVPTRELAEQVYENAVKYGKHLGVKICKIFGGVSQNSQAKELSKGVDILIATTGRLLDLHAQRKLSFRGVEYLVLDEADRMLDMGFIKDIRKICGYLPADRQSMLFSATLSRDVEAIASTIVKNPRRISISPENPTVEKIKQEVCFVEKEDKVSLLKYLLESEFKAKADNLALVFCRTKHGVNKVANRLSSKMFNACVIHSDKSQSQRKRALEMFKNRESRVLVATDIASRGLDIKSMPLVINFDLPEEAETYVHRIGRTARAEADGRAISLCAPEEVALLRVIEKYIKKNVPYANDNPFHCQTAQDLKESNKNITYKRPPRNESKKAEEQNDDNQYGNFPQKHKKQSFSAKHRDENRRSKDFSSSKFENQSKQGKKSQGKNESSKGNTFKPRRRKGAVAYAFRKRS